MNNEDLKAKLTELLPAPAFEEGAEWLTMAIEPSAWKDLAQQLRASAGLDFDYLFCVTPPGTI